MKIKDCHDILVRKFGFTWEKAQKMCLATLLNEKNTGAALCTTPGAEGHEEHDSTHHEEVKGFLEEIRKLYPNPPPAPPQSPRSQSSRSGASFSPRRRPLPRGQ